MGSREEKEDLNLSKHICLAWLKIDKEACHYEDL